MEERLPLYENGVSAGVLLRREEGLHTVFSADCPDGPDGEGMRKLWLQGEGGGSLLLGTLLPEPGHRWRLDKRVSRSQLAQMGLTGAVWGEILAGQEPAPAQRPQTVQRPVKPEDPVIAAAVDKWPQGRWQRFEDRWRLSYSWQVGRPFPMVPLFCFANVSQGEVFFLLNEAGYPVLDA